MSGTAIGIDLGTTNSCVAVFRNGKVEIIANEFGYRITPSYVSFNKDEQRVIGDSAKNKLLTNEKNTIFNTKRLLGRSWYDKVVQSQICNYPFTVIKKKSRPHIVIEAKKGVRTFSVEQISAMILKRMVKIASEYLNEKIRNVVITVPAYFNDAQRDATKNAGLIAGLNILRIINEPTAAALAYGFDKMNQNKTILVFDLGGGTLDVSILKIENNTFTVLATSGNTYLGGEDFDQNVIDYYIKFYQMKYKKDFTKDPQAVQKLRKACEIAKKELTFAVSSEIVIESFFEGETFFETLSRTKFEELNKESFSSTMRPVKKALDGAKLKKSDINEVLIVGGSSRIPKIQELLTKFFNGKKPFQDINPDEAIAYGAAIEAARVSGQESSVILHDVNPLSLGVKDYSQKMLVFIPRNTRVPTKAKKILTTVIDYQESVSFSIYEGELPVATDNLFLGEFTLTNIQKALAAVPTLETTFEIDDNGILNVSAVDVVTNERKEIAVDYCKNRPTTKELEEMIKIAEKYDEIEEKYNESISLRIEFHDALYTLKSRVDGDKKLTNSNKAIVEKFIEENLCWLNENKICEIAEYKQRKDELDAITHNYFK